MWRIYGCHMLPHVSCSHWHKFLWKGGSWRRNMRHRWCGQHSNDAASHQWQQQHCFTQQTDRWIAALPKPFSLRQKLKNWTSLCILHRLESKVGTSRKNQRTQWRTFIAKFTEGHQALEYKATISQHQQWRCVRKSHAVRCGSCQSRC